MNEWKISPLLLIFKETTNKLHYSSYRCLVELRNEVILTYFIFRMLSSFKYLKKYTLTLFFIFTYTNFRHFFMLNFDNFSSCYPILFIKIEFLVIFLCYPFNIHRMSNVKLTFIFFLIFLYPIFFYSLSFLISKFCAFSPKPGNCGIYV